MRWEQRSKNGSGSNDSSWYLYQ